MGEANPKPVINQASNSRPTVGLPPLTTFGLVTDIPATSQHNPKRRTPQKSDTLLRQIYIFPGVGASAYPQLRPRGRAYVSDITNIMGVSSSTTESDRRPPGVVFVARETRGRQMSH